MITPEFKKEVLKILQTKYRFGPITAKNLFESNLVYVEANIDSGAEVIASSLEEIYLQDDDDE